MHDRALGRDEHLGRDRLLGLEHGLLQEHARRVAGVAGQPRQPADRVAIDQPGREHAARAGRQAELALAERGVEVARVLRRIAEVRIANPEPDTRRGRLVGIDRIRVERRPAPRPDALDLELLDDLLRREGLQLDDVEPGRRRLQPGTGRGVELHLERDTTRGDADLGQVADEPAHALAHRAARARRAELVQADRVRRGEVDLPEQDRDLRDLPPPLLRVVARRKGRIRDREQRACAEIRQRGQELEHVRPVLAVRRRPGGRRLRAEELVLGDQRVVAGGRGDCRVEQLVRALRDHRRVGGLRRGADAIREIEVEVDGLGALGPQLWRDDQP